MCGHEGQKIFKRLRQRLLQNEPQTGTQGLKISLAAGFDELCNIITVQNVGKMELLLLYRTLLILPFDLTTF